MPSINGRGDRFVANFSDNPSVGLSLIRLVPGRIKTDKHLRPNEYAWPLSPWVAVRMEEEWSNKLSTPMEFDSDFLDQWNIGKQIQYDSAHYRTAPDEMFRWAMDGRPRPPWKHQARAFAFLTRLKRGALFAEMRTGKTKVVLETLLLNGTLDTLVVCPKSAIGGWVKEASINTPEIEVVELDGSMKFRALTLRHYRVNRKQFIDRPILIVTNYESLVNKDVVNEMVDCQFECMVIDEAHKIKSPSGVMHKAACRVGRNCEYRYALTGTPAADNPMDVYGIYHWLDASIFGTMAEFKREYALIEIKRNRQGQRWEEIVDFINQDDLNRRMYDIAFRVTQDVLDLPPSLDVEVPIRMNSLISELTRQMIKESAVVTPVVTSIATNALTKVLRLQQLTSGFLPDDESDAVHEVGTEKKEALQEIFEQMPLDPIVVFYRFDWDLHSIRAACSISGRVCYELNGHRDQMEEWKSLSGNQIIAVQLQAGSAGVDLSRAATAVYFSNSFSLETYQQSRSRLVHGEKSRTITYYHLIGKVGNKPSVDETIYEALDRKENVTTYLVDWLKGRESDANWNSAKQA